MSGRGSGGWAVVAAAAGVMFVSFGTMYTFGVFFNPILEEFRGSRAGVSWIGAITTGTFLLLGALSGPVADRFGTRPVTLAGGVLLGGGLLAAGRATALWQLYATQGFLVGAGMACTYVSALAVVGRRFDTGRRALAIGITASGSGIGMLTYAPVGRRLIEVFGWRGALTVLGLAGGGIIVACALLLHGRGQAAPAGMPLRDAVRARPFRLIYTGGLVASFAFLIPVVHIVPYARDHGIGPLFASFLLATIGASSTVGRFALGAVAHRIGHRRSFAFTPLGMAGAFGLWLVATSEVPLVAVAILYGTFQGGFVALLPTVAADYFGTAKLAGVIGLLNTCGVLGALAGPVVAGALFDAFGAYTLAILLGGVVNLFGFGMLLRLPEPAGGEVPVTPLPG